MKKSLILVIGLLFPIFMTGNALAVSLVWDVSVAGAPAWTDANTLTGVFDQIGFDAQTSTYQFDSDPSDGFVPQVGDPFQDTGNMMVNGLLAPTTIDTEGLKQLYGYQVTAYWDDVEGYVSDVQGTLDNLELDLAYTSGTINFYLEEANLDGTLDAAFANPAGTHPDAGAGGVGFEEGTLIATFSLLQGIGHTFIDLSVPPTDIKTQGSVELYLEVDYLLPGFWYAWFEEAGGAVTKTVLENNVQTLKYGNIYDLTTLFGGTDPLQFYFFTTDMNLDTTTNVAGGPTHPDFGDAVFTAYSNENGSAEMTIVPEPSTFVLLGAGLLGLVFVSRKRSRGRS